MNKKQRTLPRISALLLAIVLLISMLSGCNPSSSGGTTGGNSGGALTNDALLGPNSVVIRLAEDKSIPEFDTTPFANVEICFNAYYYTALPDNATLLANTKAAFEEFCSHVDKTDKAAVTHALIDCYIYAIGDVYAFFRNSEELEDYNADMGGSFVGIGVSVIRNNLENTILVTSTEPDSPAREAGIMPDDYIIAVDGALVSEIGAKNAVDKIKGEIGTKVVVTVLRGDEEIDFELTRALITETFVTYEFLEGTKIAYIKIKSFKGDDENNTAIQFRNAITFAETNSAEGIIFDVRSNPGGYLHLVVDMLSYLVPNETPIASFSSSKSPIFAENDGTYDSIPYDHVLKIPSVVICDKNSASAAELFAGALRDYNEMGILNSSSVGQITYKKGIMQSTISFKDGSALTLTTALYNPPLGENFHGVGVTPNVLAGEDDDFITLALAELEKITAEK